MFKKSEIILPKQRVSFEEENHKYMVGKEEKRSVTDILSFLSAYKYKGIPHHILEQAAQRGKRVHFAVEVFCKTGVKMSLDDSLYKNASKYFEGFLKWYRKYGKKYLLVANEFPAYADSLNYAGTIDIVVEPVDDMGMVDIIDIKTTTNTDKKLVAMQLAGYKMLLLHNRVKVRNCYSLLLTPDADYKFDLVQPEIDRFHDLYEISNWYSKKEEE